VKHLPVVPTILVLLAIAAMIALGVWQLQRRDEKLALLARYAANQHLPAIPLPQQPNEQVLFRRASAVCLQPTGWHSEAGRAADGSSGWRVIADCRTEAGGQGFAVQLGIAPTLAGPPAWQGGPITGYITNAPGHRALIQGIWDHSPQRFMLVAETPLAGLKLNAGANLADIPNNHLAYAVQWFIFATLAAIIYAIALRRRPARKG